MLRPCNSMPYWQISTRLFHVDTSSSSLVDIPKFPQTRHRKTRPTACDQHTMWCSLFPSTISLIGAQKEQIVRQIKSFEQILSQRDPSPPSSLSITSLGRSGLTMRAVDLQGTNPTPSSKPQQTQWVSRFLHNTILITFIAHFFFVWKI